MLKINKDHEEGVFNKNGKQFMIKISSLVVAISMFSGLVTYNTQSFINREQVVSVSSDVRHSIYKYNDYLDGIDRYSNSKYIDDEGKKDLYMTEKTLANVDYLTINMIDNEDLSFLSYCDNLEEIRIINAQLLSTKDIDDLNNSNLKVINLELNFNEYIKNKKIFDFLSNNFTKTNINLEIIFEGVEGELSDYILYVLIKNWHYNLNLVAEIDTEKYKKIDDKINEIITQIDFSVINTEEELVYELYKCVANVIDYDFIAGYEYEFGEKSKVQEYNEHLLSSVLLEPDLSENYGVCVNYAALFSALAYKCNLESYYITGRYVGNGYKHAWNLVKVDGAYKYIDITNNDLSDLSYSYGTDYVISRYKESNALNDSLKDFKMDKKFENIKFPITKNEMIYYNLDEVGKFVNLEPDYTLPAIISLGSGGIVGIIYTLKYKKTKEDDEIKKR